MSDDFLCMGTPTNTCADSLYKYVEECFQKYDVSQYMQKKLVGIATDGASNMTGVKKGLTTLFKQAHPEIVAIHCLCHRLELAFKDSLKKYKQFDKLCTLLIGIYYFYNKSSKQKKALQRSNEAAGKGVLPTKTSGTRWLPHLEKSITNVVRSFTAIEAQLADASNTNAKAEGLHKLLTARPIINFMLFLKVVL